MIEKLNLTNDEWCVLLNTLYSGKPEACSKNIYEKIKKHVDKIKSLASEKDIGKLCWFWDKGCSEHKYIGILHNMRNDMYRDDRDVGYDCCRRLTLQDVAKITGYKVEKSK